jgi:hypothetical protein
VSCLRHPTDLPLPSRPLLSMFADCHWLLQCAKTLLYSSVTHWESSNHVTLPGPNPNLSPPLRLPAVSDTSLLPLSLKATQSIILLQLLNRVKHTSPAILIAMFLEQFSADDAALILSSLLSRQTCFSAPIRTGQFWTRFPEQEKLPARPPSTRFCVDNAWSQSRSSCSALRLL